MHTVTEIQFGIRTHLSTQHRYRVRRFESGVSTFEQSPLAWLVPPGRHRKKFVDIIGMGGQGSGSSRDHAVSPKVNTAESIVVRDLNGHSTSTIGTHSA